MGGHALEEVLLLPLVQVQILLREDLGLAQIEEGQGEGPTLEGQIQVHPGRQLLL